MKVWHAHMMFPDDYREVCSALNSGDLIKHDPRAAFDDPLEKNERLRRTKEVYKIIFGQEAPHEIWPFTSGYRVAKCQMFYTDHIFQTKFYPKRSA